MIWDLIHDKDYWGGGESRSGKGSSIKYTKNLVPRLESLFRKYGIRTVFDAPCGDGNWAWQLKGVEYSGGDISPNAVASARSRLDNVEVFDITQNKLPDVDLWLCRDCLNHLKNTKIDRALANFANSNIKYMLISHHPFHHKNWDLTKEDGSYRKINFEQAPWNLHAKDTIDDWIPGFPRRQLILLENHK